MSVEYFNGIDDLLITKPKGHIIFDNPEYKYARIDGGGDVENPDYDEQSEISRLKLVVAGEVDLKTFQLINTGFTFDSEVFSASPEAISDYTAIQTLSNKIVSPINFPIKITLKDRSLDRYSFDDIVSWNLFVDAIFAFAKAHKDDGGDIREAVQSATTLAEIKSQKTINNART